MQKHFSDRRSMASNVLSSLHNADETYGTAASAASHPVSFFKFLCFMYVLNLSAVFHEQKAALCREKSDIIRE